MALSYPERLRRLQAVWRRTPEVRCLGLCQPQCSVAPLEALELKVIEGRIPGDLPMIQSARPDGQPPIPCLHDPSRECCPLLGDDGRCGAYSVRPMICRLYGGVEGMECPHGCRPPGGLIPREAGWALLDEVARLSRGL